MLVVGVVVGKMDGGNRQEWKMEWKKRFANNTNSSLLAMANWQTFNKKQV